MTTEKENIIKYIDDNAKLFTGVADEIWENPELSLKEFKSAALYEKVLREVVLRSRRESPGWRRRFPVLTVMGSR